MQGADLGLKLTCKRADTKLGIKVTEQHVGVGFSLASNFTCDVFSFCFFWLAHLTDEVVNFPFSHFCKGILLGAMGNGLIFI